MSYSTAICEVFCKPYARLARHESSADSKARKVFFSSIGSLGTPNLALVLLEGLLNFTRKSCKCQWEFPTDNKEGLALQDHVSELAYL